MHNAKTCKWQVKIRNLMKEQINFISGPKLLPTLSKADAVVIEHGNTSPSTEETATLEHSMIDHDANEKDEENLVSPTSTDLKNNETTNSLYGETSVTETATPTNSNISVTPKQD